MTGVEDIELSALKAMGDTSPAMGDTSPAMADRRRRILGEARKMISTAGPQGFTMRELGRLAEVSTRTIYNIFGSRETVLALAIHSYYEKFMGQVRFEDRADTFSGALARQATSTLRDIEFPHYMRAVVELYFSLTLHSDIRAVLLEIATRSWRGWLHRVEEEGLLVVGVRLADFSEDLSNLQYCRILDWCKGEVGDEAFVQQTLSSILRAMMGITTGLAHREVAVAFRSLQTDPEFWPSLLDPARRRIRAAEIVSRPSRR